MDMMQKPILKEALEGSYRLDCPLVPDPSPRPKDEYVKGQVFPLLQFCPQLKRLSTTEVLKLLKSHQTRVFGWRYPKTSSFASCAPRDIKVTYTPEGDDKPTTSTLGDINKLEDKAPQAALEAIAALEERWGNGL